MLGLATLVIILSAIPSSAFQAGSPSQESKPKQYTYVVNDKTITADFPVFVEGSDKKVTKDVFHGYQLYNSYCFRCHGTDATESSLAPGSQALHCGNATKGVPDSRDCRPGGQGDAELGRLFEPGRDSANLPVRKGTEPRIDTRWEATV